MKLIVGLGNPGAKYALTRHNTGFRAVDVLASLLNPPLPNESPPLQGGVRGGFRGGWKEAEKFQSLLAETTIAGAKVLLAKPQTFMNKSGQAVRRLVDFYKIRRDDVLIIYDDIDLLVGTTRLRLEGSAGGHQGMKSVLAALRTDKIARLRIGIAEKVAGKQAIPAEDYVLRPFSKTAEGKIKKTLAAVPAIVADWIK